jgi:hypothetical protein
VSNATVRAVAAAALGIEWNGVEGGYLTGRTGPSEPYLATQLRIFAAAASIRTVPRATARSGCRSRCLVRAAGTTPRAAPRADCALV